MGSITIRCIGVCILFNVVTNTFSIIGSVYMLPFIFSSMRSSFYAEKGKGFPGGSAVKTSPANAEATVATNSTAGLGRSS